MEKQTDLLLLARFRQGDEQAFKQIFERFHKELVSFATFITGQQTAAQDIVIDAFLKILPRSGQFASIEKIRSYLYVLVRHAAYAFNEQEGRMRKKQQEYSYLQQSASVDPESPMDQEEMMARTLQQLYEYVQQLPPQEKKVFIRKIIQRQSVEEIAAELNISAKTVYNLAGSAISRLRQWLGNMPYPGALILISAFVELFSEKKEL